MSRFTFECSELNKETLNCVQFLFRELGRKEKEVLQKMAEITKEGFLLKQQLIEEAKKGKQEKQVEKDETEFLTPSSRYIWYIVLYVSFANMPWFFCRVN